MRQNLPAGYSAAMVRYLVLIGWLIVAGGMGSRAQAGPFDNHADELKPKTLEQVSTRYVSDWGGNALAINEKDWLHGETEHFIIHYFKRGQKIATRCEDFYAKIRKFFGDPPDIMGQDKSHVYAFHDVNDWKKFAATTGMGNIAGVTRDAEFFYIATDETGRFDSRGKVQAHEMTHLVFNRLFHGTPPLWLNEGIAEYFGQRETSSTSDFRRLMGQQGRFPMSELLIADAYPADARAVSSFYGESAIIVDFLTYTEDRRKKLPTFLEQMIKNEAPEPALKIYGYQNVHEFIEKYEQWRKTRY